MGFNSNKQKVACLTKKGQSHLRGGTECQDFSLACSTSGVRENIVLISVADGHGGKMHENSSFGSKLAVEAVSKVVEELSRTRKKKKELLTYFNEGELARHISQTWRDLVLEFHKEYFKVDESLSEHDILTKYGTTLLFSFVYKRMLIVGQIGDGGIGLIGKKNNIIKVHIADTVKESSQTASLCLDCCVEYFKISTYKKKDFSYVLMSTDGVFDAFINDSSYLEFALELSRALNDGVIKEVMSDALTELEKVSDDDMSVALMRV